MFAAVALVLHFGCTPVAEDCSDSPTDTALDTDTASSNEPNFEDDVYEVYDENCADCHERWGGRDESDVYDFLLAEEAQGFRFVVPGVRAESLLYSKVGSETPLDEKARMPVETLLTETGDLARLSTWITAGAADNSEWQEIQTIVWKRGHCSSCHDEWGKSAGEILDNLLTIEKNSYWLIDPGDPELSLLFLKLSLVDPPVGVQMPIQYGYLTADQIERIGLWIDAGAPPSSE